MKNNKNPLLKKPLPEGRDKIDPAQEGEKAGSRAQKVKRSPAGVLLLQAGARGFGTDGVAELFRPIDRWPCQ